MQKTLIILKPDTVMRGLIGKIITRFEDKGFIFMGLKLIQVNRERAEALYSPHFGKAFYPPLIEYLTSGPVVVAVLAGEEVISQVRNLMGKTNPQDAAPGSVRGDFGQRIEHNLIHGSDSPESAESEIPIFFTFGELLDYSLPIEKWL